MANNSIAVTHPAAANVYLSCSWHQDKGQDASWLLVDALDKQRVVCLGDAKVSGDQDPGRIRKILQQCSGAAIVIPYRPNQAQPTSQYIWQEVQIAANEGVPIAIWHDSRVPLRIHDSQDGKVVAIEGCNTLSPITVISNNLYDFAAFDSDGTALQLQEDLLGSFIEKIKLTTAKAGEPFAFFSTRLKPDFELARAAVQNALEDTLGVSCLWADSNLYATETKSVQQRTLDLITNAQFVIADLTFGPESPDYDSPSRAHEVGMAEALQKEIFLTSQSPRRSPYFNASHLQMKFWDNEQHLRDIVCAWANNLKAKYGRRIYNRELAISVPNHVATLPGNPFSYDEKHRYFAPNAHALTVLESTVVAIGFACIALAVSLLAKDLLGFADTFDYASIVAGLATIVFASDLNGLIRSWLVRWAPLRWLIPATGLVLLMIWTTQHYAEMRKPVEKPSSAANRN